MAKEHVLLRHAVDVDSQRPVLRDWQLPSTYTIRAMLHPDAIRMRREVSAICCFQARSSGLHAGCSTTPYASMAALTPCHSQRCHSKRWVATGTPCSSMKCLAIVDLARPVLSEYRSARRLGRSLQLSFNYASLWLATSTTLAMCKRRPRMSSYC